MSVFLIVVCIVLILLCTYVGMNNNIKGETKSGFYVVVGLGGVGIFLLGMLLS